MKRVLVGGPRSGKSTYAKKLREHNIPTYCTDSKSMVKDLEDGVIYLPEGLSWSEASQFVVDHWFPMRGPWCIEGVGTVRALRKFLAAGGKPNFTVTYFSKQYDHAVTKEGQKTLAKGVETVWREIEEQLKPHLETY